MTHTLSHRNTLTFMSCINSMTLGNVSVLFVQFTQKADNIVCTYYKYDMYIIYIVVG